MNIQMLSSLWRWSNTLFGVMFGLIIWSALYLNPYSCLPLKSDPNESIREGSKNTRQLHPASKSHPLAAPNWQKRQQSDDDKLMVPADQMTDNMIDQQLAEMETLVKDEFSDSGFGIKGPSKFGIVFGKEIGSPGQMNWKRSGPHSHSRRGTEKKCRVSKTKKTPTTNSKSEESKASSKIDSGQKADKSTHADEGSRKQTISGGSEPIEEFAEQHYLKDASGADAFKPILPIVILKDDGGGVGSKHKTQILPAIEVIESD